MKWIQLTPDQLASPNPELEEQAAQQVTAHNRALEAIGDYLKVETDEKLFRAISWAARIFELVKRGCDWILQRIYSGGGQVSMSASKPDRLSGKRGEAAQAQSTLYPFPCPREAAFGKCPRRPDS